VVAITALVTALVTGVAVFGVMFALVGVQDTPQKTEIQDTPQKTELVIPEVIQTEDARLAQVEAWYEHKTDRLTVAIYLTDSNGDYTKAKGNAEISIYQGENMPRAYADTHNFVKDDFVTWRDDSGNKVTGYVIDIRHFFPYGDYDLFVDLDTQSRHWADLHDSFFSLN